MVRSINLQKLTHTSTIQIIPEYMNEFRFAKHSYTWYFICARHTPNDGNSSNIYHIKSITGSVKYKQKYRNCVLYTNTFYAKNIPLFFALARHHRHHKIHLYCICMYEYWYPSIQRYNDSAFKTSECYQNKIQIKKKKKEM